MICQAIKIMSFSSVLDNRVTIAYIIIYQQPAMVLCGPLYQTRVKEFIQTAIETFTFQYVGKKELHSDWSGSYVSAMCLMRL